MGTSNPDSYAIQFRVSRVPSVDVTQFMSYVTDDGRAFGPDGVTIIGRFINLNCAGDRMRFELVLDPDWQWLSKAVVAYRPYLMNHDDGSLRLVFHDHSGPIPQPLKLIPNKEAYTLLGVPLSTWTKWCTSGFPPLVDRQVIPKIIRTPPAKINWDFWELMMWRYNTRDSLRIVHSIANVQKKPRRLWRKDGTYNNIK